jgi:hypothetical protein
LVIRGISIVPSPRGEHSAIVKLSGRVSIAPDVERRLLREGFVGDVVQEYSALPAWVLVVGATAGEQNGVTIDWIHHVAVQQYPPVPVTRREGDVPLDVKDPARLGGLRVIQAHRVGFSCRVPGDVFVGPRPEPEPRTFKTVILIAGADVLGWLPGVVAGVIQLRTRLAAAIGEGFPAGWQPAQPKASPPPSTEGVVRRPFAVVKLGGELPRPGVTRVRPAVFSGD